MWLVRALNLWSFLISLRSIFSRFASVAYFSPFFILIYLYFLVCLFFSFLFWFVYIFSPLFCDKKNLKSEFRSFAVQFVKLGMWVCLKSGLDLATGVGCWNYSWRSWTVINLVYLSLVQLSMLVSYSCRMRNLDDCCNTCVSYEFV